MRSGRAKDAVIVQGTESAYDYDIYLGSYLNARVPNILSNPFEGEDVDMRRYASLFVFLWSEDPQFKSLILQCRGKRLYCPCNTKDCHGFMLTEFLKNFEVNSGSAIGVMENYAENGWHLLGSPAE